LKEDSELSLTYLCTYLDEHRERRKAKDNRPNPLAYFEISLIAIPQADDIFVLSNADSASTDLVVGSGRIVIVIVFSVCRSRAIATPVKLVTNDGKHEIFPQTIRNALSQTNDPFSAGDV
jgi:hypothetical protein